MGVRFFRTLGTNPEPKMRPGCGSAMFERLFDDLRRQSLGGPKSVNILPAHRVDCLQDGPGDHFSFPTCVGCDHNPTDVFPLELSFHDFELLFHSRDGLIFQLLGQNREITQQPFSPPAIVISRVSELDQMADRPGDHEASPLQEAALFAVNPECFGKVSCDGRLFSQNQSIQRKAPAVFAFSRP